MTKDYEFADITPMIIHFDNGTDWYHPYINDYYTPDQDTGHDTSLYGISFENSRGESLQVYFKSRYIDRKLEEWYSTGDWDSEDSSKWPNKNALFNKPFIDLDTVYGCLDMTLLEDVWGPMHPNGGFPRRTTKEWNKWVNDTNDSGTNQFCFSKPGRRVSRFFKHDADITLFSLDYGMITDGKKWWCDS